MVIIRLAIGLAAALPSSEHYGPPRDPEPVISIDKCKEPSVPIGRFRGVGVIRLPLSADGRPDTARIEVGSVQGLSAPGLRSVAARQLAACRFRIQPRQSGELLVLQQIRSDSGVVDIRSIPAAGRAFAPLAWSDAPLPTEPLAYADSLLDEKPRQISCKPQQRSGSTVQVSSQQELDAALREVERQGTGQVKFSYVVGPDGRFVPGSATMVSSTNPMITQQALILYESCRYAPGRVRGFPVATRMEGGLNTRVSIER